jgi:hypothetical protein
MRGAVDYRTGTEWGDARDTLAMAAPVQPRKDAAAAASPKAPILAGTVNRHQDIAHSDLKRFDLRAARLE